MPAAFRWHGQAALQVPENITLLPLPPYSPELNLVERVWLYLRERFLSFRLYQGEQAIVDALCAEDVVLDAVAHADDTALLGTIAQSPEFDRITTTLFAAFNVFKACDAPS